MKRWRVMRDGEQVAASWTFRKAVEVALHTAAAHHMERDDGRIRLLASIVIQCPDGSIVNVAGDAEDPHAKPGFAVDVKRNTAKARGPESSAQSETRAGRVREGGDERRETLAPPRGQS